MRLLVCGGRDYHDAAELNSTLDRIAADRGPIEVLIHGAARGADTLAHLWAEMRGIPVASFPADWDRHGRSAGAIRNGQMLTEGRPDLVVAFPGGNGTANMVRQSRERGVEVIKVDEPEPPEPEGLFQ